MSKLNSITLVGNLTAEPELRFTSQGDAVVNFRIASNERYQRNGETHERTEYVKIVAWNGLAENVAASCNKGTRVVIEGKLQQREAPAKEEGGDTRWFTEVVADQVAVSLQWARIDGDIVRSTRDELKGSHQEHKDQVNAEVF